MIVLTSTRWKPHILASGGIRERLEMLKLKFDEAGHVVVQDNKPVYVDDSDNGRERPIDVDMLSTKITALNGEAMGYRKYKEEIERQLAAFEGVDPEKAREAIKLQENLSAGELKTAAQVEEIKANAMKAAEQRVADGVKTVTEKLTVAEKRALELTSALSSEKIGNAFATSKYISEKLTLPAPAAQKIFGEHFRLEEGKIMAYGSDNRPIISKRNPGDFADTEEAIELLVDSYAYRDNIVRGTGGGSGGRPAGGGGGGNGAKQFTRAEFDKLDPTTKSAKMGEGYRVVD